MEMINGYQCKTCTDVDYAKKHIDPAHPKDGPYGQNKIDKTGADKPDPFGPAVTLDGQLKGLRATDDQPEPANPVGGVLDISA